MKVMERYYYHGIGDVIAVEMLDKMLMIMDTGVLKSRNDVGYSGDEYEHVCLYKKHEAYDYASYGNSGTAYDGWIRNAFCFIISPNVAAQKVDFCHTANENVDAKFTDLVDEWRSEGDISLDRVVGIGLPLDEIKELRCLGSGPVDEEFDEKLLEVLMFAESMDWVIVNSNEAGFADRLDARGNTNLNNKSL